MLSASNTLHSSVQRVSAVGMEDSVPEGGGAWGRSGGRGQHGATPTREKPRPLLLSHAPPPKSSFILKLQHSEATPPCSTATPLLYDHASLRGHAP